MPVQPVLVKKNEVPYVILIHTGANYPQLHTIKKWHYGTMTLTINPGSDATESQPLKVKELFQMNTEGTVAVDYWLPKTIGVPKLLKVDLESHKREIKKYALFVREITILYDRNPYRFPIKNFVYPHNPIRGNPTVAKMGCPPHFLVREGAGTLRHQETEDFIIRARQEDLETIQSMVEWATPQEKSVPLYPGYLNCKKYEDLPRFLKFREARLDAYLALKVGGKKEIKGEVKRNVLQKLVGRYKEETFTSFDHYRDHMIEKTNKLGWSKADINEALKVSKIFHRDEEFGRQMLCGPNAIQLRKVESLEGRWMNSAAKVPDHALEGQSLKGAMCEGRLFEVTTDPLVGIPHGGKWSKKLTGTNQTWYVILSDCMLYQTDSGQLVPVLIRIENRNDGEAATFWTPPEPETSQEDPKYLAWLLAKMYFRSSDLNRYALCAHFCRAHAVNETFAISAYRNLPNAHPMLRFLQPHIQGIIPVNVQARDVIFNPETFIFAFFMGVGDGLRNVFETFFKEFSYEDLLIPENVEKRGVKDIPEYLHRDDMLDNWELIKEYVCEMVNLAYLTDKDVLNDDELQNFAREVVEYGFAGFVNGAGFPRSFPDKAQLAECLTAIIFNISVYHASVNFQTFTYSFAPNVPSAMRLPPPKQDEEVTMERILNTLPVAELAFISYNIAYNLGKFSPIERFYLDDPAENKLGIIGENMAVSPKQVACIRRLTEGMRGLKDKIDARNVGRHIKYDVLNPVNVPLTTQT